VNISLKIVSHVMLHIYTCLNNEMRLEINGAEYRQLSDRPTVASFTTCRILEEADHLETTMLCCVALNLWSKCTCS